MYIDQGEVVRVRVEADEFYDDEPGPPKAAEGVMVKREARRPPYTIIVRHPEYTPLVKVTHPSIQCSIEEQGLGPVSWWKSAQVEAQTMDEG